MPGMRETELLQFLIDDSNSSDILAHINPMHCRPIFNNDLISMQVSSSLHNSTLLIPSSMQLFVACYSKWQKAMQKCGNKATIYTVKPPNRGHFGDGPLVPCREVVLFSQVLF